MYDNFSNRKKLSSVWILTISMSMHFLQPGTWLMPALLQNTSTADPKCFSAPSYSATSSSRLVTSHLPLKGYFIQCCGSGAESGSVCFWVSWVRIRYGSWSGSFYHQEKTSIPAVLWLLYDFLSLKSYENVVLNSNKQKTVTDKNSRIRSRIWIRLSPAIDVLGWLTGELTSFLFYIFESSLWNGLSH